MTNPSLVLTFLGNDLEPGHSTTQTISNQWIVNHSYQPSKQLLNGLKSSSDQIALTIFRKCPSVEDIIATEGNIKAVLKDGDSIVFTGFVSTSYSWTVTDHGEQALAITIESIGTRLFSQPFIETGYHFFDSQASAAVYDIITPLGLAFREGDERKILQPIRREVEAGKTVRELMDSLFYECNAVYWFNNLGELCVEPINPSTSGASSVDSAHLFNLNGKGISLSKSLRTYKGARVRYSETANASNYLVYRNTTGADDSHPYCNLKLGAGEWYDGGEIYTNAEWSEATADEFREPLLISAVNAGSETEIVGSGKIVAISNAKQKVTADSGITVQIEAVGGKWFKITCHNTSGVDKYITRLDLYADIVYEKTQGIIRTQIDGSTEGKSLYEEEMSWIHDKDNAQRHGNLLAQYYKHCGATYTFYSDLNIALGSAIRLIDDVFSGLDVYVLVFASKGLTASELIEYRAVGISTFNLDESVFHGTQSAGSQSAAQGTQGEAGESAQVQYALGNSPITPPSEKMLWADADMEWNGEDMIWEAVIFSDTVPVPSEGQYVWMRQRVGNEPWQYMRVTGENGKKIVSATYQYALGNNTETAPLAGWFDYLPTYVDGKYYWRRIKLTYEDGSVQYSDAQYDYEDMPKRFQIVSPSLFTVNHRKRDSQSITMTIDRKTYTGTATWTVSGGTLDTSSGDTVHLSIPYDTNLTTITVTAQISGIVSHSIEIEAVDETSSYMRFAPKTTQTPGTTYVDGGVTYNYIKGDYYLYRITEQESGQTVNVTLVPMVFDGSAWQTVASENPSNYHQIQIGLLSDVFEYSNGSNSVSTTQYDYFKNVIIEKLTAKAIGALFIEVLGAIYGGLYDQNGDEIAGSDALGGFWLNNDGQFKAEDVDLNGSISVDHAYVKKGIFRHDPFYPKEFM